MKKILKFIIVCYQRYISKLLGANCRYEPTCSHYALEALEKHGAFKGSLMTIGRICRCHPFVKGGVDPVPNYFTLRRNHFKDDCCSNELTSIENHDTTKTLNRITCPHDQQMNSSSNTHTITKHKEH